MNRSRGERLSGWLGWRQRQEGHARTQAPHRPTGTPALFRHWALLYGYDQEQDRQRYLSIRRRAEQLKCVIGILAYRQLLEIQ